MNKPRQSDLINTMSDKEVTFHLVLTQVIIVCLSIIGSWLLFDSYWNSWASQFHPSMREILIYGLIPGLIVVAIDLILMKVVPPKYYDDGGINMKVFKNRSVRGIVGITLLVAVSEEMLFRGVLHAEFGYYIASITFAVMHIRYLKKFVLLISVLFVSFFIGYMYEITGNLLATMSAHFVIDLLLAFYIRFKMGGRMPALHVK
ncbi:CPBP family intramembrane glutamic endopeptidase [Thalassobacillus devorans]|uniref:CPBP family intramembrane glutamic endopeptidase n=1 Tax=Thalassobacillus devorans TaxID=279813 RepID=UPI00048AE7B3|nr:CPBP family intramembrane glutamic endopeptidase [Thalassobacillus devorans]